mgnify:CR=1 FL=1
MKLLKWGGMLLFAGALALGTLTLYPDTTHQLVGSVPLGRTIGKPNTTGYQHRMIGNVLRGIEILADQ